MHVLLIVLPCLLIPVVLVLVRLAIAEDRNCKLKALQVCGAARSWVWWRAHWSDQQLWRACPPEWKLWYIFRTQGKSCDPLLRSTLCDLLELMPESDLRGTLISSIKRRIAYVSVGQTSGFIASLIEKSMCAETALESANSALLMVRYMLIDYEVHEDVLNTAILARYPKPPHPEEFHV